MSERAAYFRNQADKCERHARAIVDTETQAALRKLAAEYVARAAEIEGAKIESKE
jgi:hypothetical protein